jgi:hypothetical protein
MRSTQTEAEEFVDSLVEEWVETPPLRGVTIRIEVVTRDQSGAAIRRDDRGSVMGTRQTKTTEKLARELARAGNADGDAPTLGRPRNPGPVLWSDWLSVARYVEMHFTRKMRT